MNAAKRFFPMLLIIMSCASASTSFQSLVLNADYTGSISSAIMNYEINLFPFDTIVSYYNAETNRHCLDTIVVENSWSPTNHRVRVMSDFSHYMPIKSNDTIYFLEQPFESYIGYYWNKKFSMSVKEKINVNNDTVIYIKGFELEELNKDLIDNIYRWDTNTLLSKKCPQLKDASSFRLTRVILSDGKVSSISGIWLMIACW